MTKNRIMWIVEIECGNSHHIKQFHFARTTRKGARIAQAGWKETLGRCYEISNTSIKKYVRAQD